MKFTKFINKIKKTIKKTKNHHVISGLKEVKLVKPVYEDAEFSVEFGHLDSLYFEDIDYISDEECELGDCNLQ